VARATYSAEDKGRAYVVLQTNEGNLKRTARDTGIPEPTIRRWRNEWAAEGPPPTDMIEQEATGYIGEAEVVRNLALRRIKERLESDNVKEQGTLPQLATVYGIVTDKIDRARGIADRTVEHRHSLPSPDEIRGALTALVAGVQQGHAAREEEIEDAEIIEEPRALPPGEQA
jgi:transposase-like protein